MALLLTASTRGYSRGGGGRRSVERVGSFTAHSPLSRYNTTSTSSFQRKKLDLDRCAPYLVLVAASASLVAFGTATGYNYNHLSLCNSSSLLLDTTTNSAVTQCSSVLNDEPSKSGIPQPNDSSPLATMAFASTASFRQEPNPIVFEKNNSMPRTKLRTRDNEKPYDISVRAIKGGRVAMEDEYFVGEGGRFVAVFDGHGGGGVSQYLKRNLYQEICKQLKEKHWEQTDDNTLPTHPQNDMTQQSSKRKQVDVPTVFAHVSALKAAFQEIDRRVLADETLRYQGSTAVAVLVHENIDSGLRTLLSANVGDSRAILSRRGKAINLTRDHKPNDEVEKARIMQMGETIEWDRYSKVHRVRNLSLSRAIGDRYAKPVVTGEVEIKHYPVTDNDEFVLLASDGLWDVMASQEVVDFVHQRFNEELSKDNIDDTVSYKLVLRKNMAKFVAREAIRRGSGDNVCVIMVWLNEHMDV